MWTIFGLDLNQEGKKRLLTKTPLLSQAFCLYWQLKRRQWLMTWDLNTRISSTLSLGVGKWGSGGWGGYESTSTAFQMQLVWVVNFYFLAQDTWWNANLAEQRTNSFQMWEKCIIFASKEYGALLQPSMPQRRLINNQMVNNETILWGHGKRNSIFKETLGFSVTANTALINSPPETCPPWLQLEGFFTRHNANTHGSFSSNKLSRRYHFIPGAESMEVVFICQHLNTKSKSKSQNEEARVWFQKWNTQIINHNYV